MQLLTSLLPPIQLQRRSAYVICESVGERLPEARAHDTCYTGLLQGSVAHMHARGRAQKLHVLTIKPLIPACVMTWGQLQTEQAETLHFH